MTKRQYFPNKKYLLDVNIEAILNSVLIYLRVERNEKKSSKQTDVTKHMTSEDALKILKEKGAEKICLDIGKEEITWKNFQKQKRQLYQKKHQKPMNSSNELKKKSAQESKSRNLMSFFYLLGVALVSETAK